MRPLRELMGEALAGLPDTPEGPSGNPQPLSIPMLEAVLPRLLQDPHLEPVERELMRYLDGLARRGYGTREKQLRCIHLQSSRRSVMATMDMPKLFFPRSLARRRGIPR